MVILVVSTHPDDETLGCGGTLLKHKANNDEIHWLIATDIKESEGYSVSVIKKRDNEINKVGCLFGFASINKLELTTTKVDEYSMSELITKISSLFISILSACIFLIGSLSSKIKSLISDSLPS